MLLLKGRPSQMPRRQATLGICTTKFRRLKRAVADSMGSHSEQMFSSPCAKAEAKKGSEVP